MPQHLEALEKANRIRFARAGIKRDLKARRRDIKEFIVDVPEELETATLFEMLESIHRWGVVRAQRFLNKVNISETYKMGLLTEGQKRRILEHL